MTPIILAVPGDPDQPTGGTLYDRRVMAEIAGRGRAVAWLQLPGGFPLPTAEALAETARALAATPEGATVVVDGLALGALPPGLLVRGRKWIALVHHPLALETGLTRADRDRLAASERAALAVCAGVIVTSHATRATLERDYAVSPMRVTVAEPGTDPRPRASGGTPPMLLSVGAVTRRKAHAQLIDALYWARGLDWRLTIVGALDRDPSAVATLRTAIAGAGFGERVTLAGAAPPEAVADAYLAADIYVSTALHEGYGMALAEALASGLPIAAYAAGAVPETVPAAAAELVAPGDTPGLGRALDRLLRDPDHRHRLADAAWAAGQRLPRWSDTASAVLRGLGESR